jgi:hypothetical protein
VAFVLIGIAVFIPAATRPALILAVASAAAIWVVAENLGEILTGTGTDPNTGPLLILLAAAYWPGTQRAAPPRAEQHGAGAAENAPESPIVTGR